MRHVEKTPCGCWLWTGAKNENGYGFTRLGGRDAKQSVAHRAVYLALIGPIPDGLVLDHTCRTPACVNPAHLEPVTQRENLLRGRTIQARNKAKTRCLRGHALSGDNLIVRPNGGRGCRACKNALQRERRARAA